MIFRISHPSEWQATTWRCGGGGRGDPASRPWPLPFSSYRLHQPTPWASHTCTRTPQPEHEALSKWPPLALSVCAPEARCPPRRTDPRRSLRRPWKRAQRPFKQRILGSQRPIRWSQGKWFLGSILPAPQISCRMRLVIAGGGPGQESLLPTAK